MDLRDLIVTPILLMVVFITAYLVRPYFTNSETRRYFIPALTVRVCGAICLGLLYQFYYDGGDTYNFHTHGSRHIWEAFFDDPDKGYRLFIRDHDDQTGLHKYYSQIPFYKDSSSFAIIRLAALIDLFTFSTYSATAVIFAIINFIGMWLFFLTFYNKYPHLHKYLAIAAFFIPSVFFWGSGLLKDTITLSCLGIATYAIDRIFILKKFSPLTVGVLLLALYSLFEIKIYILLVFLPATILWIFMENFRRMRSLKLKVALFLPVLTIMVASGYYAVVMAGQGNPRYAINNLSKTAQITAYDIRYYTGREAGSGYSLGELDGSWESIFKLAPQAINVSLFRPYLWEVRNFLMLPAALESMFFLFFTGYVLVLALKRSRRLQIDTVTVYCLIFGITFAFAVGVSTYNFGSLTRYKIPILPFYLVGLILLWGSNKDRNVEALEETE